MSETTVTPLTHLVDGSTTLTVLIHGFEGRKEDWLDAAGFSKGGALTQRLDELGRSWIACDLYGHGDWETNDPEFRAEHISDELFPRFLDRSADAIREAVELAVAEGGAQQLEVVTYSAGCHVAVRLLQATLPSPVTTLGLAVPTPDREHDDEYSLHNHLAVFEGRTVGLFVGRDDDEIAFDESVWFFDQLPGSAKRRWDYDSGHALPVDWVDDVVSLLTDPTRVADRRP